MPALPRFFPFYVKRSVELIVPEGKLLKVRASLVTQMVKNLPAMQEAGV